MRREGARSSLGSAATESQGGRRRDMYVVPLCERRRVRAEATNKQCETQARQ